MTENNKNSTPASNISNDHITKAVELANQHSENAIVSMQQLGKAYGDHIVLERINADVNKGEFITIVGPSGCGKTTLLKLLLGTELITQGNLLLDGEPIASEPNPDRGVVFQKYSVFPHLTARENVALSAEFTQSKLIGRTFGAKRKRALADAQEWLAMVGLQESIHKYPHELSGGMQQRLAIAQTLTKHPRVLLLDEPFGALDPGIRNDMQKLTLELWQEHQLTVFMITHDIQEAFDMGSRVWVVDKIRNDPHDPQRYGSTITFDIPLEHKQDESLITKLEQTIHA